MVEEKLIPVFIPPLALVFAHAEKQLGRPITEVEAEATRDEAACVMMEASAARAMDESRGFRDVEPEDCWADWHRLQVQVTGAGYLPKLVLCFVGTGSFASHAQTLLKAEGVEHEIREADSRMYRAFAASELRFDPSLGEQDMSEIGRHTHVIYALSDNFPAGRALETSRRFLILGARLLDECGGSGMKCESSGIAHGRARWLELAARVRSEDAMDRAAALVRAFVQHPISDQTDLWTCGMHLLGRPDLILRNDLLPGETAAMESARLFDIFASYLLLECTGERHFGSGHTFRCDEESRRFIVRWEACSGYEEDDFFFNPFGRWRFGAAD